MPDGGRLTIETRNEILPSDAPKRQLPFPTGSQVVLAVSDTGCGMDADTRERAFEPFFTTKPLGKGTGLGLSTVYGIVRQSDGYINLDSAPGGGTMFEIYLPRVEQAVASQEPEPVQLVDDVTPAASSGTETVLLVEDEEAVRDLTREILEMHGYHVLSASNGHEAIHAYDRHDSRIDLLLTDVVMPVMGGRELARKLTERQNDLKILYASGYADDTVFHEGRLEPSAAFLGKPFTPADLATKVREVLETATDDSSATTQQP